MAANLRKYIVDPKAAFANRARKMRLRWGGKLRFAGDLVAGNYTGATIDLTWDGKPTRIDLINKLIAENGYRRYLEIGCRGDDCFRHVGAEHKVGVDPEIGGTLRMTSDTFFARNKEKFDIVFIDGLHTYEQVLRDILNAVDALTPSGTIVTHDCLPRSCRAQFQYQLVEDWNGDVWKAFVQVRTMPNLDAATCLIDHGVGVIRVRTNSRPLQLATSDFRRLRYKDLARHYRTWMNTIEFSDITRFVAQGRLAGTAPA